MNPRAFCVKKKEKRLTAKPMRFSRLRVELHLKGVQTLFLLYPNPLFPDASKKIFIARRALSVRDAGVAKLGSAEIWFRRN